jgi:hypothetical protein
MEHSPSSDANSSQLANKFPAFYEPRLFIAVCVAALIHVLVINQTNAFHPISAYLSKINFNIIILPSTLRFSKCDLFFQLWVRLIRDNKLAQSVWTGRRTQSWRRWFLNQIAATKRKKSNVPVTKFCEWAEWFCREGVAIKILVTSNELRKLLTNYFYSL